MLEVHAPDPEAFLLEPLDKMAADKTARARDECFFHLGWSSSGGFH
jgi:hypothetical protein